MKSNRTSSWVQITVQVLLGVACIALGIWLGQENRRLLAAEVVRQLREAKP